MLTDKAGQSVGFIEKKKKRRKDVREKREKNRKAEFG